MRSLARFFGNALTVACLLLVACGVFYPVKARLDGGVPRIAGHALYVVLSGSMTPAFDAGSVVAVAPVKPEAVRTGDVITFKDPNDASRIITHRVVEVRRDGTALSFVTRGDANNAADRAPVPADNVLGRVGLAVPYAGYIAHFVREPAGFTLLIALPVILVIVSELLRLFVVVGRREKARGAAPGVGK